MQPSPAWVPAHARPIPPGRRKKRLIIGIVAAVVLVGSGTLGLNGYAKHRICSALGEGSTLSTFAGGSSDEPSATEVAKMRQGGDELRAYGHLLMFDPDLRSAVNGFADDIDRLADLMGDTSNEGGAFTELVTLASSVDTHVRQAQEACGQPVRGILHD
jgi:hypothetical protein